MFQFLLVSNVSVSALEEPDRFVRWQCAEFSHAWIIFTTMKRTEREADRWTPKRCLTAFRYAASIKIADAQSKKAQLLVTKKLSNSFPLYDAL